MKMDNSLLTRMRNELITFAKMNRKVDYLSLSQVAGHKDINIPAVDSLLKEVSIQDHSEGKPFLWSIVIEKDELPSDEYFDTLKHLGVITGDQGADKSSIHVDELSKVFAYWSRRRKTGKRKR